MSPTGPLALPPRWPHPPRDLVVRGFAAPGAARPPVVAAAAGPGYGKTLALRMLLDGAIAAGEPVLWVACEPDDDDPAALFGRLVGAMRAWVPGFGESTLAIAAGGPSAVRRAWQDLLRELVAYGHARVAIALDDLHHLQAAQPETVRALGAVLDRLPPGVSVLLATRGRPPAPLVRLQAAGTARILGEAELRLAPAEVAAFLAARAGGDVPAAWQALAAPLDGWPLGLDVLARPGTHAGPAGAALRDVVAEIWEELPAARQALLLRAATLEVFDAEAVRAAFGLEDAHAHLQALEEASLVRRLGDGSRFDLVPFLQAFVAEEARRTVPAAERAAWSRAAAGQRLAEGDPERALAHLLAAGDAAGAAAIADDLFPLLRFDGRHATIARLLAAFPPGAADAEPVVRLWLGHLAARDGDHVAARAHYEAAQTLYEARDDQAGVFRVLVRRCYVALVAQDLRAAGPLLLATLARQAEGKPSDRADLALQRAYTAEQRGDMALMRACNQDVLEAPIAGDVDVAASHGIALQNLHTAALHAGDLEAAAGWLDRVAALAGGQGFLPYRVFTAFLRADLALTRDEAEAAGALLRDLPDGWRDLLDWHDLGCAEAILGRWHEAQGAWREAEDALARARTTFARAGSPSGAKLVRERQAWLALRRGAPERAVALTAEDADAEGANVYDAAVLVPRARALQLTGDAAGAVATLEAAMAAFASLDARLHLARAGRYLAAAKAQAGDRAGAEAALGAAQAAMAAGGWGFLVRQDPALATELQALAAAPAAAPATPRRARAAKASGPLPQLVIRSFGAFEATLDDARLDRWPRRKAQLVLAATALHPRGLTLAELADLAAAGDADAPGPERLTTLKVAISYLRQVLEPDSPRGNHSRMLPLADERYALAPEALAYHDVAAFEAAAARAEAARHAGRQEEAEATWAEALGHYRGNLHEAGWLARFFEAEREHLRRRAVGGLLWLAGRQAARGDRAAAEAGLGRATALAPTDEDAWLALIAHHAAGQQPDRARLAYWDARKAFKKHLGAGGAPGPRLEAAHRALAGAGEPVWAAPRQG